MGSKSLTSDNKKDKEYNKKWRLNNKDCIRKARLKWNKNNPNIFCSVSHAVTYRNLNQPKDYWKQQYEKRKDVFDIKNYSGNMWDEYSPFKYFITKY